MTGSIIYNRQHSSTAGLNLKTKLTRPKLRRCSSVDDHGSFESTTDDIFNMKFSINRESISSDNDSGIEDSDQQPINIVFESTNERGIDEIPEFVPAVIVNNNNEFEEYSSQTTTQLIDDVENFDYYVLWRDIERAGRIKHEEKKEFCQDTSIVFHGEFARNISMPISLMHKKINYYLFPESDLDFDPKYLSNCAFIKLDNAKAQFKCPNPECARLWTSMRARISFRVSFPMEFGYVFLKVYEQNCQICGTTAEPLWYMEEVCRVMENLAKDMSAKIFSESYQSEEFKAGEVIEQPTQYRYKSRHDSSQRKGNMRAPHDSKNCAACHDGVCYS